MYGFSFSWFMNIQDWTEVRHDCKLFSAVVECLIERTHTAGYHQHKGDMELRIQKSCDLS